MATETNYSGEILTTLMTEAVASGSPAMVKEVQRCANENLFQHQVKRKAFDSHPTRREQATRIRNRPQKKSGCVVSQSFAHGGDRFARARSSFSSDLK